VVQHHGDPTLSRLFTAKKLLAHTLDNYTLDLQLFFAAIDRPIHHVSFREIDRFIDAQHHQG